jgi:hypothetical protein
MRSSWKWALVLAVPALWVSAALPGEQQIYPEGSTVPLVLLRQKSVQEELKITPELAKKIVEFTDKEAAAFGKALKLKGDKREKRIVELEKKNKKFLKDSLSAEQRKRLDQITLQVTGLHQLGRPEVIKKLNLTTEQQKKVKAMQKKARKEFAEILSGKDKEGRNEKLAKLREEIDKKIDGLLTKEQRAKAKKMIGEPFRGEILFEESEQPPDSKGLSRRSAPPALAAPPALWAARATRIRNAAA